MPTTTAPARDRAHLSDEMGSLRERLRKQAYLYESPHDFRAGVDAALNAYLREATRELSLDVTE